MPAIGFGIFQIPENETERIVNDAIETGYRWGALFVEAV